MKKKTPTAADLMAQGRKKRGTIYGGEKIYGEEKRQGGEKTPRMVISEVGVHNKLSDFERRIEDAEQGYQRKAIDNELRINRVETRIVLSLLGVGAVLLFLISFFYVSTRDRFTSADARAQMAEHAKHPHTGVALEIKAAIAEHEARSHSEPLTERQVLQIIQQEMLKRELEEEKLKNP